MNKLHHSASMLKGNDSEAYQVSYNVRKLRSSVATDYFKTRNSLFDRTTNYGCQNLHPIWNIPPLDLSPKLYTSSKNFKSEPSKPNVVENKLVNVLPKYTLPKLCQNKNSDIGMITRFRVLTANTDRRKQLKIGYHSKEVYSQPRPRHFNDDIHRSLGDMKHYGKEDFHIKPPHDACSINFKNETLKKVIPGLSKKVVISTRSSGGLNCNQPRPLKWDSKLYLPKTTYTKGKSSDDIFFECVESSLDWLPYNNETRLDRPNIHDNKTTDWLELTRTGYRHFRID